MSYWLLKTEPTEFSFGDLQKKKHATWDGVANPTALKHIRSMKKGDVAVIYHTGKERRAVGTAEISSGPYGDPVVFDVIPKATLAQPVTLDVIKETPIFADSPLIKIGRLSVVPLTKGQMDALLALSKLR